MDVLIDGSRCAQIAGMLHEREIAFSVAIGDVSMMIEKEQGNVLKGVRRNLTHRKNFNKKFINILTHA